MTFLNKHEVECEILGKILTNPDGHTKFKQSTKEM